MEVGTRAELTVLSPSDVSWIRDALKLLKGRGNQMAQQSLEDGLGRPTTCTMKDGRGRTCGAPARYFSITPDRKTTDGYCQAHWRKEGDPSNRLGFDQQENADERAAEPSREPA